MTRPITDGIVSWPDDVAAAYRQAGHWQGRALGEHIWQQADVSAARVALVDGRTKMTYAELTDRADAAATRLSRLGLSAGERLLVQLPNGWEFVVLMLACLRSGIVPVMALPAHRKHELSYLATHAEAAAIAVPDMYRGFDHQHLARELRNDVASLRHVLVAGDAVEPDSIALRPVLDRSEDAGSARHYWDTHQPSGTDAAVFLLSGGTTGLPKLIVRTHNDYAYNARCSAQVCGFDAETVYLVVLPAGHNFPLACPGIVGTLIVGGQIVLLDSPQPARAFETIAAQGVTHTAAVPAVVQTWIGFARQSAKRPEPLQVLQVGGARIVEEIARQVKPTLGCTLQQVYGMAEGLLNYTRLDDPEEIIVATQGRPISPADEILLVDEFDQPVPSGERGSLLTRGPYTPRGYYRANEHNSRAFTRDGWYRSGDICRWHPSGNLVVEGRDKDLINRGGEKISAEEIENLVYTLPEVVQVAAIAMPDPDLGERLCLYVVAAAEFPLTLDRIRGALVARGVAAYKLPDRVIIVDALPDTKMGKIDKAALRKDIARRLESERPAPPPSAD